MNVAAWEYQHHANRDPACLRYPHASIESYVISDSIFVVFELYLIQMVFRQLAVFQSSCGCLS